MISDIFLTPSTLGDKYKCMEKGKREMHAKIRISYFYLDEEFHEPMHGTWELIDGDPIFLQDRSTTEILIQFRIVNQESVQD